jgi:AcrR family transcriptional regulator
VTEIPAPARSLRDRKKIKLRQTIQDTAMRQFLSRGFEKTTLEQVCDEAETSLRTLLRYFPTKEDLALGRETDGMHAFGEVLAALDPSMSVMEFWRNAVVQRSRAEDRKALLKRLQFFEGTPPVTAKLLALQVGYENLLADAFAREAGVDPTNDIYGRLLAGMLIAGNRAAGRKWVASRGKLDLPELRIAVVDWAIANFPPRPAAKAKTRHGRAPA